MKKKKWNYVLHFNGIDFANYTPERGDERFVDKRYFETLHDAFNSLVQTDINQFDKNTYNMDGSSKYYSFAEITAQGSGEPLVRVVKRSIDDAPEAMPVAGIYLNFDPEMDMRDFERQSGFDFKNFGFYDPDIPFLLLAKYAYDDEGLKLMPDLALNDIKDKLQVSNHKRAYDIGEWAYTAQVRTRHFQDDLTFSLKHNTQKDGPLVSYETFHYHHPADAFDDLIRLNMYALNEKTAFNKGLGNHIEQAVISNFADIEIVSLESITEIASESRRYENGIYLKFFLPIEEFEKLADVNLSSLDNYNKLSQYQQILRYTTDRNDLLLTSGYCKLIREAGLENADSIINQYPSISPYVLRIEWDFSKQEPVASLSSVVRHGELPFVSYEEALRSLCDLDDRSFNLQQCRHLGHPLYIKHAAIYDTADNKPIISKFMAQGNESDLPGGVYIKLNGEKTTVETLHETLRQLPSIQQQSDFHFMVSQPMKASAKSLQVRTEDSETTRTIRKTFPWYKKGQSL